MARRCSSVRPVLTFHSFDPVVPQAEGQAGLGLGQHFGRRRQGRIELGAVRQCLLPANPIRGKGLPEVGKESAVLILADNLVGAPIEEFDAETLGVALLNGCGKFQGAATVKTEQVLRLPCVRRASPHLSKAGRKSTEAGSTCAALAEAGSWPGDNSSKPARREKHPNQNSEKVKRWV